MGEIRARISGRTASRAEVSSWEDRRIDAAARKIGVVVEAGTTDSRRSDLLKQKLDLGADEIARRLRRDVAWADRIARTQAGLSPRRRISTIHLDAPVGSATEFGEFFAAAGDDQEIMLGAAPDHFVLRNTDRGQEVLETTGGSPFASLFHIDLGYTSALVTTANPAYPVQIAGVARSADGTAIGGVRHQFRDVGRGFEAWLTVEFPLPTLPTMIRGHRWHLACEFSNWIEDAFS